MFLVGSPICSMGRGGGGILNNIIMKISHSTNLKDLKCAEKLNLFLNTCYTTYVFWREGGGGLYA